MPVEGRLPKKPHADVREDSLKSAWQMWLLDWEEKQRASLQHYEEATKELVNGLRKDLLEKLGEMEKVSSARVIHPRNSHHAGFLKPIPEQRRDKLDSVERPEGEEVPGRRGSAGSKGKHSDQTTHDTAGGDSLEHGPHVWRPVKSYQHMNDAMTEVVGAVKYARGATVATSATHKTAVSSVGGVMFTYDTLMTETEEYLPTNSVQRCLFQIVQHPFFAALSGLFIGLYAIAVGVVADMEMRAAIVKSPQPAWRSTMDTGFTIWCVTEFLLRLAAEGIYFFKSKDRNWNLFDMLVALLGLLDVAISHAALNFTFLRVLRTFRAMRLLRIIRFFRIFKELRLMMASILCCLVPLGSAFALLVTVIYIFAVILLQGASDYVRSGYGTEALQDVLRVNFCNMGMAIYSLTQAISGGRSWSEFADPFLEIQGWYGAAFAGFVIFVIFGILNILTGVFVEATTTLANVDKELVIQEQIARNESEVGQMRNLFREIDDNQNGTITRSELMRNLKDERVRAYFSVLQMDVSEAHGLFQLLDRDESGEVSIDEFIMNCMRLKGTARSLDLAAMLFENKRLHTSMRAFMANVDDLIRDIHSKLGVLQTYQDAPVF